MSDLTRYRDDIVLLYVEDRLSIIAIANRYAAAGEDVRRLLKVAGVELRSGPTREWRNSADAAVDRASDREGCPVRPAAASCQSGPDEAEDPGRADRIHVGAVVHALGGKGFPYLNLRGRQ